MGRIAPGPWYCSLLLPLMVTTAWAQVVFPVTSEGGAQRPAARCHAGPGAGRHGVAGGGGRSHVADAGRLDEEPVVVELTVTRTRKGRSLSAGAGIEGASEGPRRTGRSAMRVGAGPEGE